MAQPTQAIMSRTGMGSVTRDEEFYFEDGSCVLQVRDRLFNLHRSILSENSAFFKQMFSLPQQTHDLSGQSDDHPIWCDDSVDDFRAVCHILYRNLTDPGPEPATLDAPAILRIARIASLAHKYEFSGIQKWSHKVMSGSRLNTNVLRFEDASFVLNVALECSLDDISGQLVTCLFDHLSRDKDKTSIQTASKLRVLLDVAGRHGDIPLQAGAYYLYLGVLKWSFNSVEYSESGETSSVPLIAKIPTTFPSLSALNDTQKLCLLRGFSQLSSLKARLRVPPVFSHSQAACITPGRQADCQKVIQDTWERTFAFGEGNVGLLEILGAARPIYTEIARISPAVHLDCAQAIIDKVSELKLMLKLELPNYFGLNRVSSFSEHD